MDNSKKELLKEDLKSLKKILKKYTNYYRALYQLNPSAAEDFKKKQEHFYTVNKASKEHEGCHHEYKIETKSKLLFINNDL